MNPFSPHFQNGKCQKLRLPSLSFQVSPAYEGKLTEVAEVEKGVGTELREASKTLPKSHVLKTVGMAVVVTSMVLDAAARANQMRLLVKRCMRESTSLLMGLWRAEILLESQRLSISTEDVLHTSD
jgi:hypothetical protein